MRSEDLPDWSDADAPDVDAPDWSDADAPDDYGEYLSETGSLAQFAPDVDDQLDADVSDAYGEYLLETGSEPGSPEPGSSLAQFGVGVFASHASSLSDDETRRFLAIEAAGRASGQIEGPVRLANSSGRLEVLSVDGHVLMAVAESSDAARESGRRLGLASAKSGVRRGRIRQGMSPASKKRFQRRFCETVGVFRHFIPCVMFVTLTLGRDPVTGSDARRFFKEWRRRLLRRDADVSGIWVREFQKRGQWHWHLVLFPVPDPDVFRDWASVAWVDVSGLQGSSRDARLRYGVDVRPCEDPDELLQYLGKEVAKAAQKVVPDGVNDPGRAWGEIRPKRLKQLRPQYPTLIEHIVYPKQVLDEMLLEGHRVKVPVLTETRHVPMQWTGDIARYLATLDKWYLDRERQKERQKRQQRQQCQERLL